MSNALKPASAPGHLAFSIGEYQERRKRVRALMESRGIDILYVTSPANLYYLSGYEAIWYPNRLPLGLVIDRATPEVIVFDWSRHVGYVSTRVLCDEIVLLDYGTAPETVARTFEERGWTRRAVAIEWSSPNPAAPVMSALAKLLGNAGVAVANGDWVIDRARLYKSADEVACVRRAAVIADDAMLQLQRDLRPGLTELELSAHLSLLLAQRGSEVAAMSPLVNSGPTAWADTHAFPSKRRLESGDVVAVDCCAVVNRYHVNLGRTFFLGTPNRRAARMLELAGDSIHEIQKFARLGEGPETAAAAANKFVRDRIAAEHIWWVGGYALGIAFAPNWVGFTYLANDGLERCSWEPGYVSNYETVFLDEEQGFEAACIDSILMTDKGLEILSSVPRGLLPGGV
jgi:Xaa-Pro aminopeptidase